MAWPWACNARSLVSACMRPLPPPPKKIIWEGRVCCMGGHICRTKEETIWGGGLGGVRPLAGVDAVQRHCPSLAHAQGRRGALTGVCVPAAAAGGGGVASVRVGVKVGGKEWHR